MSLHLRSHDWFGKKNKDGIIYRSWMKNQGMPTDMFDGRPVIGICNTFSELTPCNAHFREHAEMVKRGVLEAGGFPLEFPVMSLGETLLKPTAMLFRNLASMDTEESIRGNPIDGVVLLTGCDKTTPSTVMGAASVGLPTIVVPGGPMLNGRYKGQTIGSGTHVWKFDEDMKTGKMTQKECEIAESCMSRSIGHCMTMGTASTMACMVESLGLTLSGAAAIPAADSRKRQMAQLSGRRIVEMVKEDLTINKILTKEAFENAILVNAAVGGSSNFIIHLIAIAGRIGVDLTLEDFDRIGSKIPLLLNLMPSGKFLMEDFYYAGGLPVILNELKDRLHKNIVTVTGRNHHENIQGNTDCYNNEVIATYDRPLLPEGGCVVVKGNLALNGAVIKPSAATPALMKHKGRAVVFESIEDYNSRIDDPELDIDESSVMVLKYVGPVGYPGMPELGNMALPKKILEKGIKDMVRISDGRMSGTAYGTAVLHVSPESAVGGNLALVQNGDMIELDVAQRRLHLDVSDEELKKRRAVWVAPAPAAVRGYVGLYIKHVMGADKGADLDFLVGSSGSVVTRDSH
ncbi:MAG: IlvD/Edd family dehydratase [Bacteroidota bacterium]|nr:IlvD/Edd family dehydratase [Bacteroidota bacterium]MDP4217357.1 IlvD/Edd family dehydratase [Bacteroidota bacterium]MDP4245228.1 IlvD/Edd family dehydratase [Bacteroidota bacterium]MDP4255257.1 IlvD/Edd family dehydratase [Bacteroidota bacterium]MDP4257232.1 IlvD/Edd family dehydratase [Bacteroidota bacterium]